MDCQKTGSLIRRLRSEKQLTQRQLAECIGVSDKTVSKWENGRGAPDVSLLAPLAQALEISAESLLKGELQSENTPGGNMKKTLYYFCPVCGNLITASGSASISCCGRTLEPMKPVKPDDDHLLTLESVEDEWYLSTAHPMTREHFIAFIAFVTGDRLTLIRQYPEWDLQQRITRRHGLLLWYCTEHGLFYKNI